MRAKRTIWFFIMIIVGLAGGLYYGWVFNPVKYVDTSPETLRADYKADYVLMVAEIYQSDHDLTSATQRLAYLGKQSPELVAAEGLSNARLIGFSEYDLTTILGLSQALSARATAPAKTAVPTQVITPVVGGQP